MSMHHRIPPRIPLRLRQRLEALTRPAAPARRGGITLGAAAVDAWLGGGLARGALHEVFAGGQADLAAATGFAVLLALRAAGRSGGQPVLWVRHDGPDGRAGRPYPPGLAALGLDPERLVLVRAPDVQGVLRAAAEAARCDGLGAVLAEIRGDSPLLDLTASRRLSLAAEGAGTPVAMLRDDARPLPSAAASRWRVEAQPSRPQPADAPGPPAFAATLLRHRGGAAGTTWHLEWDDGHGCFREREAAEPGAVASLPAGRAAGADGGRRAG